MNMFIKHLRNGIIPDIAIFEILASHRHFHYDVIEIYFNLSDLTPNTYQQLEVSL